MPVSSAHNFPFHPAGRTGAGTTWLAPAARAISAVESLLSSSATVTESDPENCWEKRANHGADGLRFIPSRNYGGNSNSAQDGWPAGRNSRKRQNAPRKKVR